MVISSSDPLTISRSFKHTEAKAKVINSRAVIVPPSSSHSPPGNSLKVVQTQNLLKVRLDVFLGLRIASSCGGLLRHLDRGGRGSR